ncbi:transcriptional repressor [bacterium]|jgi:Fur family transcriptional regulator, ferric uptake regulator|nr:transcriptional repressor [bacterium]
MKLTPLKKFENYLVENEGRLTSQKKAIVEEVFNIDDHFEVENFIDKLRSEDKKFSRATVYRTIKQLLDAGLIQKISALNGKVFYERKMTNKEHDHVICNTCGEIYEINDNSIQKILDKYCKDIGFRPEYRSLHIYGLCKDCFKR